MARAASGAAAAHVAEAEIDDVSAVVIVDVTHYAAMT